MPRIKKTVKVEDVKLGDWILDGIFVVEGVGRAEHRGKPAIRLDLEHLGGSFVANGGVETSARFVIPVGQHVPVGRMGRSSESFECVNHDLRDQGEGESILGEKYWQKYEYTVHISECPFCGEVSIYIAADDGHPLDSAQVTFDSREDAREAIEKDGLEAVLRERGGV